MTWTYGGNPSASNKDAVRFLIGNTSSNDPVLISDEEIAWLLTQNGGVYCAAASAAEAMVQQYASKQTAGGIESLTVGNLSESYGDRVSKLEAALPNLRRQCQMRNITPVAGGVLFADKLAHEQDTSLTPHVFSLGMDDNPPGSIDHPSTSF